ncbi:ABC-type organic anion transporter ABCA8 isoform X2 [Sturnira hondurensis]|uniref:ABC-type organic anion transporter ABCA8 isoform X2 n=1 Tax=Sturnira hondurensis TaxID=192404 RepID=UPI0018797A74|nr:ABC-type organic anion transporter ABCA8 isoform X2 [Sturnira hondurensis]XP_036925869.1 ABC-type organic anion transporter ABCA8 isoform X2 [Sturnira hondurensis]
MENEKRVLNAFGRIQSNTADLGGISGSVPDLCNKEWLCSLFLLLLLYLYPIGHEVDDFSSLPTMDLNRVDSFNLSDFAIAYAPVTNATQQIMNKVASASFVNDKEVFGLSDEDSIEELEDNYGLVVRVIFTNTFSYHLKFTLRHGIPTRKEHEDHLAPCHESYGDVHCEVTQFWKNGIVTLQAVINAAIIEVTTNHSVMEELMSVTGKNMKIHPYVSQDGLMVDFFIFFCIVSFSPFVYYASLNVTRERKRMKGLMTMMGLQNAAFWLSWGLLYAGFIFITSLFLALIIKSVQFLLRAGFMVVFTHFFLYGLSLIALAFLMSVLIKKSFLTGLVVFLLTVFWGCVGFTVLYRHLPASLEWLLGCFSPFAFMLGMVQLLRVDYDLNSNAHPDSSDYSNRIIATNFMLAFDIFLYLALMIYFEKVLPNEHGHQHSPLFFLKSSFWSRQRNAGHVALDDAVCCDPSSTDSFEPVSPEFHGKEAIRIRNVTKEYKGKPDKIKALKDLTFDIYEGQITAILGHSGAGKSTLLNILSGLSVPTKGLVTVYNNKLSEMADLENISKLTGICPQFNVQFDFLTVKENLRLFAKIKGIQPQGVEEEIQRVLMELEMKNIQNVLAQNLSGGQKRKLTVGITILGDPQVLLLDEPTAGLDPFSRHQVWNLLKGRKMDHVILFSTQFMDEADILADRKVFLSKGKLKCAGSSLFLKKKWGIGYHLSLQLNEMCVKEKITSLVTEHIPDAKLSAESEGKLVYTLPLETTNKFPELYEDLDLHSDLGIETYGVSMTTLNEVFLKLEGESTIDEPDIATLGEAQAEGAGDTERLVEMELFPSSLSEMRETVGGVALWGQQILAIAKVRFLKLKHERKALLTLLLILGIAIIPLLWEFIISKLYTSSYTWELTPHLYFLAPGQQPHDPLTQLLIINKTGASIDDFIHSVEHQNIALNVDVSGTGNGLDDPSYNGVIIVSGHEKNYRFSLACNVKRLNCFPVLMHIVSNGLLKMVKPSASIQTDRTTFQGDLNYSLGFLMPSVSWLLLLSCCAPYIAMSSTDDYKSRAWSQLRISGLFPSAYWFGQALVDVPLYWLMFLFMYSMDFILVFQERIFFSFTQITQIPCAIGYAMSLIFFTYIISFICRKGRKNSGIWSLCFFIVTNFCVFITMMGVFGPYTMYITVFLVPQSTLLICIFIFLHLAMYSMLREKSGGIEPFLVFLIPFLHFIIFLFILRCLEWKFGKKSMRKDPFFRISPRSCNACPNPEDPGAEDEDVQMERVRTMNALNSTNFDEKPVIIASCLRKEYVGKRKCCFSKTKKKIATRNVSFCVRKGEVLGLLGHNGAGKSTSIRMITGDSKPTAGQVLLKGSSEGDIPKFLGYCPQEDALWPNLTVRQHLEVFAAVKGLRKADAKVAITRLVEALKLQDQQKKPVRALSQGIKRKLCFALSMLGSPSVVLLDEPSTGMDPEGQQQMWQAIRTIVKNTERGVLLTTHYMAEAEAVCDRVAIMVSGRLRCIGSIQHLKSKFGKDYLLEMKVKTPTQVEPLHSEILRLFPQAARQERYSSLMVYKLPVEDVRPLAQAFFKLERVKQSFDLEEYSLSQSTLEQVFLELSKEQELENFDEELGPSVRQKLLLQEEP